ncbi:MAG TPA: hypothetical protein VF328_02180 [Mycobacterium sp.]
MHYVELDQFIGERYLVTVHGPLNPALDQAAAMVEVDTVLRLHSGKLKPDTACELSYALLTALTGRLRTYPELTKDVWKLEQRVTGGHLAPGRDAGPVRAEVLFGRPRRAAPGACSFPPSPSSTSSITVRLIDTQQRTP